VPGVPHLPVLRFGSAYESLDTIEVVDHRTKEPLAVVSQANPGLLRRDLKQLPAAAALLREMPARELTAVCGRAAELFAGAELPQNERGDVQSPGQYLSRLSATSGMPESLCRSNLEKVAKVLREMPALLLGLTRGLDPEVLDTGLTEQAGLQLSYASASDGLAVILPSNSPGVNSIWLPSVALKTPVLLKPGREEPWTPMRIVQALIQAGCPKEAFGFYPTNHEGASLLLEGSGRALLFGDERTTLPYRQNAAVQVHGPGRSKVILGPDEIDRFEEHLDLLVESVAGNGGRSCINASAVFVPGRGDEVAEALAERLSSIEPRPLDDPEAALCAFANPAFGKVIDAAIEEGLAQGGAEDRTAALRDGPRRVELDGSTFLRPTVIRCQSVDHPLANTEFLFPFASVVEVAPERMAEAIGPSLVVSAITRDRALTEALIRSRLVQRLNMGPFPTTRVDWDQPHEGNLFEFLYSRRAIACHAEW